MRQGRNIEFKGYPFRNKQDRYDCSHRTYMRKKRPTAPMLRAGFVIGCCCMMRVEFGCVDGCTNLLLSQEGPRINSIFADDGVLRH